jgi:fatty-acyl-CoA synthase
VVFAMSSLQCASAAACVPLDFSKFSEGALVPIRLAEITPEAYRYPLLIGQLLHAPLATAGSREIVYRDRVRYTYQDLRARIGRLADALARLGVTPGETVAVLDWDSHRYLECFFAIPMMGAVLQTVNVRLSPDQIAYTMRHADAQVALVHRDFLPLISDIRGRLPSLRVIVLIDDGSSLQLPSDCRIEYEQLIAAAADGYPFPEFDENAIATTFYTTGTTGHPKGVCFSHRQIVLHALAVLGGIASHEHGQSFRHGDVYMPMTPMFHVHAWGNPYVATLLGVKQVYPGRYVPEELLALRAREGVTYSHCVPTILQMLLVAAGRSGTDLSGWKICVGGSALPTGLARAALAQGVDVFAGYGMSETGPVLAVTRLDGASVALGAEAEVAQRCRSGQPLPLVELRIVDEAGADVPRDDRAVGEIVVRAPWLTTSYVGNPDASSELWRGGYLHTQDVARIDASGSLQITDRMKDVIKTGGEWLSSLDLENLVSKIPGVAEVAVIGVPDKRWGERPHVLIVRCAEAGAALTAEVVRNAITEVVAIGCLPRYAVPEQVTFVDRLERTSVGKINKRALRELFG